MSARELVTSLRRQGVHLWHDGERLHYKAAKGVLTPHVLDQLRHHKNEIIRWLQIVPRGEGPQVLSFAQERLWFLHQFEDAPGSAYNVAAALRLRGALDLDALERSINTIVARHTVLRSRFADALVHVQQATPIPLIPETIDEADLTHRIELEADHRFDIGAGGLVRFTLLRIAPHDHVLVTVLHHMVTDGWSMGVMLRELAALYRGERLPGLAIQYADFAAWQRETLTDTALAPDLEFWTARLEGAPPVIELATDFPRPATQSYRGDVLRFRFDGALTRDLKSLAQQCDASVFMVLLAGFAVLLHRYSGQHDIVIGTPVAGRDRREIEELIGVFSNYIPLRVDLSGKPSFREVIARVRRVCLDAYGHQHVPFEKLVEALKPERTLGASPLFQVALVLQNLPAAPLTLPSLDLEQLAIDRDTAKLDLSFLLEETPDGIAGELEYCIDLFTGTTARQLTAHYELLLRADPDVAITATPLFSPDEHKQWSGSERVETIASTLPEAFAAQVARTPDAIALVAGDERLTYRELHARAREFASHLDVQPDDRVAICLPRSAELIVAILGVLEAGAAYVPIDPAHPADRIAGIIERASAQSPLPPGERARVRGGARATPDSAERPARFAPHPDPLPEGERGLGADHLAYVIFTSGSTGVPKGVMVPHRSACSLVNALHHAVYRQYQRPLNVALIAATVFDASVQQIFGALLLGHTLHIVPDEIKRDGPRLLAFIREHDIALTDCTPSLLAVMIEAGLGTDDLPLRHVLVGGEALPRELVERVPHISVTNVYGLTECGVDNTSFTGLAPSRIPIGTPLKNSRVYLLDDELTPVPAGIPGDIWIGGPCLARGYLGDPAQTAAAYRPDPFVAAERMYFSGDRGRWLPTGDIEFLGRSDQQVKIRGYRIELAEIEATLRKSNAITDAVVLVEHDQLVAYIVPASAAPTVAELREHLANLLPPYMIPASFRTLAKLPLNASGKLDRAALRANAIELQQGIGYLTPRNDHERALAEVWATVLNRDRIGANDHFFALGGDSIKALQVVARLRRHGFKLDMHDLFVHATLSELAPHLKPIAERAPASTADGAAPLGPAQWWFLHEYPGALHHFHQALVLEPKRALDVDAFNAALEKIWRHHEALRMRFRQRDGQWLQHSTIDGSPPRLHVVDVADMDAMQAHATQLQASTSLETGPLFLAALYRFHDSERLLLAAHHLIVDGVSWRILLEDLGTAYEGQSLPPVTDSYRDWAAGSEAGDGSETLPAQPAGRRRSETLSGAQAIGTPASPPAEQAASRRGPQTQARRRSVALPREHTQALLTDAHTAYSTRIDDLLLTALARALSPVAEARTAILFETHGRNPVIDDDKDIDVSRTVGWFTARNVIVLETATEDIGRHIKQTKESVRAIVPHAPAATAPDIAFNYLGQLGDDLASAHWRWTNEPAGLSVDPGAPLLHDIEVIGFIADQQLRFTIIYSAARFDDSAIAAFGARLREELIAVIDHARHAGERALTPSDIDYEGFDIDALDQFLERL